MTRARQTLPLVGQILVLSFWTVGASACAQDPPVWASDAGFVHHSVVVGEGQKECAVGDLDGDGHLDVVVASGDVTVLLGDGEGGLRRGGRFPAGLNPTGPAVADVDGDGHLDVAVANHETRFLTLLLGNGTGALRPAPSSPVTLDVRPHPHAVRAADLDGDGRLDLVVDHREGEGLLVIKGRDDGGLELPGTLVEVGGDPYRGMAVGDLDRDGRLDLVTPNPDAVGIMLAEDPDRLGYTRSLVATEAGPFSVVLADLNGDERLDVVAALDEGSALVQVFLGDGRGAFREAEGSPFSSHAGAKTTAAGDLDGDGIDDVAIACWGSSDILLLLGGTESIRTVSLPAGANPWGLVSADLDEDGVDDLVVPLAGEDRLIVFLARPTGQ